MNNIFSNDRNGGIAFLVIAFLIILSELVICALGLFLQKDASYQAISSYNTEYTAVYKSLNNQNEINFSIYNDGFLTTFDNHYFLENGSHYSYSDSISGNNGFIYATYDMLKNNNIPVIEHSIIYKSIYPGISVSCFFNTSFYMIVSSWYEIWNDMSIMVAWYKLYSPEFLKIIST